MIENFAIDFEYRRILLHLCAGLTGSDSRFYTVKG